jgi:hypothetical protein
MPSLSPYRHTARLRPTPRPADHDVAVSRPRQSFEPEWPDPRLAPAMVFQMPVPSARLAFPSGMGETARIALVGLAQAKQALSTWGMIRNGLVRPSI